MDAVNGCLEDRVGHLVVGVRPGFDSHSMEKSIQNQMIGHSIYFCDKTLFLGTPNNCHFT